MTVPSLCPQSVRDVYTGEDRRRFRPSRHRLPIACPLQIERQQTRQNRIFLDIGRDRFISSICRPNGAVKGSVGILTDTADGVSRDKRRARRDVPPGSSLAYRLFGRPAVSSTRRSGRAFRAHQPVPLAGTLGNRPRQAQFVHLRQAIEANRLAVWVPTKGFGVTHGERLHGHIANYYVLTVSGSNPSVPTRLHLQCGDQCHPCATTFTECANHRR